MHRRNCLLLVILLFGIAACQPVPSYEARKIDRAALDEALGKMVDRGSVIGISALIYSGDEEIYYGHFGYADREAQTLWQRDTLVNIYSMTKPVTGVTLMSLYEEGLFQLDDPLSDYLPEYAETKVAIGVDEAGAALVVEAERPIQIIDIMRHTSGFGYGGEDNISGEMMREIGPLDPSKPLAQFSRDLSTIPLNFHPGEQWKYSVSVDVQARLAEVISGQPYEELVTERVLTPLRMDETGYFVPAEEKHRLSAVYIRQDNGDLVREPDELVYGFWDEKPVQINGGHGLVATIDDYMRFALMLQNEGQLDGVRVLKPETVELMATDHLPAGMTEKGFLPSKGQMGFGLDVAVRLAPPRDKTENFGVPGEFFWDGRASTLFWVDPENDLTVVFFTQIVPFDNKLQRSFRHAVYKALDLTE